MSRNRALLISLAREDRSKTGKRKKGEAWKKEDEEKEEEEEEEEKRKGRKEGSKEHARQICSVCFSLTVHVTVPWPTVFHLALPRGKLHTFTISCSEKRSHFFPRKCSDTAWKTGGGKWGKSLFLWETNLLEREYLITFYLLVVYKVYVYIFLGFLYIFEEMIVKKNKYER